MKRAYFPGYDIAKLSTRRTKTGKFTGQAYALNASRKL